MRLIHFVLLIVLYAGMANCQRTATSVYPKDAVHFSQDFLLAIKTEQPYEAYRDTLARIDLKKLKAELNSPEKKLAFWINTYNALVQAKIRSNPEAFNHLERFFKMEDQIIGGKMLSLDDIESGLLRKKTRKHDKKFFKTFQVETLDPRIHFTLNCGATSCPPVAFYSPENLNEELALAEQSFVSQTSTYDANTNTVSISELFEWYEEDFGGKELIISNLKRLNIVPADATPEIIYSPYDWLLDIENFSE